MPKVLIAGAWHWPWYEAACANALGTLGCTVVRFDWSGWLYRLDPNGPEPVYRSRWRRLQFRVLAGPAIARLNRELLARAEAERPDILWIYHGLPVFPSTLRVLRHRLPGTALVQYTNDNPFGPGARKLLWRHVKAAIPEYDLHFVYRKSNLEDFRRAGAQQVELLRSYFIAGEDYPVELGPEDGRFRCDVVFAGHFEPDGRLAALERLAARGARLNLFGGGWRSLDGLLSAGSPLRRCLPVRPVLADDYRKAISGAKISLCFLSKINGDAYTRRCFQIPAMRGFLLSEFTEELNSLFREGQEAEYFRSPEELLEKVDFYLAHDSARVRIAQAGYERVYSAGHEVTGRMRWFLDRVQSLPRPSAGPRLHILSDVPTPHNNCLVAALRRSPGAPRVITWYAKRQVASLPFEADLGGWSDNYYFDSRQAWLRLLRTALASPRDRFLFIGYSNSANRVLLALCAALGRDFSYWSDHPRESLNLRRRTLRNLAYFAVRRRARATFAVGRHALEYFAARGFSWSRLINLPVFIDLPEQARLPAAQRDEIRSVLGVAPGQLLAVGASHFSYDKGYDVLLRAWANMPCGQRERWKLVLIGHGQEEAGLRAFIVEHGLAPGVELRGWMQPEEFAGLVAGADVFLHPARFDPFGGGTLHAMASGVPVVGADGAGTVRERVVSGVNGFQYPAEDHLALAACLASLEDEPLRIRMGQAARRTAAEWPPARGAEILLAGCGFLVPGGNDTGPGSSQRGLRVLDSIC